MKKQSKYSPRSHRARGAHASDAGSQYESQWQRSLSATKFGCTPETLPRWVRQQEHGGLLPWKFKKGTRELNLQVEGEMIFNGFPQVVDATLIWMVLAFVLEDVVRRHIEDGRLVRVLENWCEVLPGYNRYYSSRRQRSPAFALVVDALRYRG